MINFEYSSLVIMLILLTIIQHELTTIICNTLGIKYKRVIHIDI